MAYRQHFHFLFIMLAGMGTGLLQRKVEKLEIIAQQVIPASRPEERGIRMDVEIKEFADTDAGLALANVYDLEPHLQKGMDLPKHNRFYQAKIDSRYKGSGDKDFRKLPNLYILTITDYDPFGYNYMVYHVHNTCEEVPEMVYEDGLEFYYFNTKGEKGGS